MDEDFPMIGKGWPVGPSRSAIPGAGLFQVAATVVEVEAVEAVESFVLLRPTVALRLDGVLCTESDSTTGPELPRDLRMTFWGKA